MYTLEDLKKAESDLQDWQRRSDNYDGNNPNKYDSSLKQAKAMVRMIKDQLKADGLLSMSESEQLSARLDAAFPYASSKEIVEFEGKKYQRMFYPLQKSRSGKTVTEWGKSWSLVK
ncbi:MULTISPECIES: hypothetical protein [Aeromonas]|nr:hypothetical protein VAWG002_19810 [Aeromonas veronii]